MSKSLKASQRQEKRVAGRYGGRTTPGSGNGIRKNDVRTDDTSFEMKYTGKKQYTLRAADLEQGEKHAIMDGREFVFGIEMDGHNWVFMSEDLYAELREIQRETITRLRRCGRCKDLFPATREFFYGESNNSVGLSARCKRCTAEVTRERTLETVRMIREVKENNGCADCGMSYPHYVMDFDHLPGFEKRASISELVNSGANAPRLIDEMGKCEVVCANCHRQRTWDRLEVKYTDEELGRA